LVAGELALNTVDEKLYFKNSAGTVKLLASNAASSGTVSSVAATVPSVFSISGSPITTSGTLAITYSGTALPVANGGTGITTTPTNGQIPIGNGTNYVAATLTAGSGVSITNSSGGVTISATGSGGTVTSVAQSFTGGLISVSGSPITTSGTLALTVAGTSGGIPYFSSASTWATSAALTQYGVVYGGGAGATPVATAAGTTGQVLTATTGGAPTWATPAAGAGTNTFTATGSIASGSPVQVNSDGTVSAPTVSTTPTNFTAPALAMASNNECASIVYMPSLNVYVCFANDVSTSYLAAKIGTPASDGTVSWGSNIILNALVNSGSIAAVVCSGLSNTVAIYFYSGTVLVSYVYAATITSTSITIGTGVSTGGYRGQTGSLAWNPTASKGMIFLLDGAVSVGYAFAFTISGTTITLGSSTASLGSTYAPQIEYDATSGYFLLVYRGTYSLSILPASISGTTVTTYTPYNTNSYDFGSVACGIGYVSAAGKVILALRNGSNANLVSVYISMSGSTVSLVGGATYTVPNINQIAVGVDNTNNVVAFLYNDTSTVTAKVITSPVSGTTITYGSPTSLGSDTQGVAGATGKLPFNTTLNKMLAYYSYTGATYFANYVTFTTASTTLTAANYIGVSTAAYTNGQTATVTTLGGKTTTVTGITAGAVMYAAGTGYTTSNTGVVAGRGLSSTSMLVSYS
jgi:hypothetical protein